MCCQLHTFDKPKPQVAGGGVRYRLELQVLND